MLAQSSGNIFETRRAELYSALQELNDQARYRDNSRKGLFCLTRINRDGSTWTRYSSDLLYLVNEYVDTAPFNNWYITWNTFKTYDRSQHRKAKAGYIYNNVHTINAFYLDFDVMNSGLDMNTFYHDLTHEILPECHIKPTAINNSGHGYHVIILLDKGVVVNADVISNLWHDIQEAILEKIADICVAKYGTKVIDLHVSDINRILRAVGSFNVKKSPEPVYIQYLNLGNRPSIWKLKQQWLPKIDKKHYWIRRNGHKIAQFRGYEKRKHHLTGNNTRTLHFKRCQDLFTLAKLRKHEARNDSDPKLVKHYRDYTLFYYAVNALRIYPDNDVRKNLIALNNSLPEPLPDSEVIHVINELPLIHARIAQNKYIYKNQTIINNLAINPLEQRHLATLIEAPLIKRRYQKRLLGRKNQRKQNRYDRDHRMYEMHLDGMTYKNIAKRFDKSTKTVQRAIKSMTRRGGHITDVVSRCNNPVRNREACKHTDITYINRDILHSISNKNNGKCHLVKGCMFPKAVYQYSRVYNINVNGDDCFIRLYDD